MAYDFASYPEIGIAIPFKNMSFSKWDADDMPVDWETIQGTPDGTREKYSPGYSATPALQISEDDTGVSDTNNGILQEYGALPDYIPNNQIVRAGAVFISDLGGSYGAGAARIKFWQKTGGYQKVAEVASNDSSEWELVQANETNAIVTSKDDIEVQVNVASHDGSTYPAAVFDRLFIEHGRTYDERYYTFTRYPEHSGIKCEEMTFNRLTRATSGELSGFDASGGNAKYKIVLPFIGIPASMVEALHDFFVWNKGLGAYDPVPLVFHHKLVDVTAGHTSGDNFLGRPPWIICDIANEVFPFYPAGSFAGADLYNGTITFLER